MLFNCTWFLSAADPTNVISSKFTFFEVEDGYDYLALGFGLGPWNTSWIGNYTGTEVPAKIVSSGSEVWVRMSSDQNGARAGFSIEITQTPYEGKQRVG